jgi:hypothetical protein
MSKYEISALSLPRWRKLKELLDVSPSPFLLLFSARLTRNWLHFFNSSSRSRYIYRAQWSKACHTKLLNEVIHNVSKLATCLLRILTVWFCKEFSLKGPANPIQWRIAITCLLQWFTFIGKILTTSLLKITGSHASMICAMFTHNDI